ncbi:CBS domain-containing protein [Agrobacterium genomosp. 3]|uniref:CBS domain-containing protein n=1 Tax=Agrobacterium tomkonis TaxID=1183410 RepID=UPI001CD90107|nr:CBS domain-containing protein [Agrobacterium tomkonis]MCA1879929.1 CBS domain-containing protein [Agrobacterium tumefaciens]MCA1895178.1 CBS domain-containing protein [Agrobacterium tomkonis]
MLAKDIMTREVKTIHSTNSIRTAVELMVNHSVSGLPVVDEGGIVIGMITEGDLLRRVEYGAAAKDGIDLDAYIKSHSWRVGDLMTAEVATVAGDTPIGTVANLLFQHKVKRVPVVENGRLAGVISRVDLLRAIVGTKTETIAAGEEAMERALKARLSSDLAVDLTQVSVTVHGGCIYLDGKVSGELQKRAIQVLVENVQGGYSFSNRLSVTSNR